jgi:DUF1680 family protein
LLGTHRSLTTTLRPESLLGRSHATGLDYVLRLDRNRLVAPCRAALGVPPVPGSPPYGGWESRPIAGHSLGHYLSALAAFSVGGDERVRARLGATVADLAEIQRGDGYLGGIPSEPFDRAFGGEFDVDRFSLAGAWVPWYSVHKIFAGLVDAHVLAGTPGALAVVTKMAGWALEGTRRMTEPSFQKMLTCEHGGMVKVFADLFGLTGDRRYLDLAVRFVHSEVLDPLMAGVDCLPGLHANTQIPKVIGLARLYELTGEPRYRKGVETFFDAVVTGRTYPIGGNSIGEHFGASGHLPLGRDTCETCNTYNMMELAEHLFAWTGDPRFADYYEAAQLNHILGSQEPDTGAKTYFVSTDPGHFKVYGSFEDSFWCCTGTGMENPARYHRFVASRQDAVVELNLFTSGTIEEDGWRLDVATDYPVDGRVTVSVVTCGPEPRRLTVRHPGWLGRLEVETGGRRVTSTQPGYVAIPGWLAPGQTIVVTLDLALRVEPWVGDPSRVSVFWGPLVLAATLGNQDLPEDTVGDHLSLMSWPGAPDAPRLTTDRAPSGWLIPVPPSGGGQPDPSFVSDPRATGGRPITFVPFHGLHHQRYSLTLDRTTGALTRDQRLAPETVDVVKVGQQQSEIDHGFESVGSVVGYDAGLDLGWRDAADPGWLSYHLAFGGDGAEVLALLFADGDGPGPCRLVVWVGDQEVARLDRTNQVPGATEVRIPVEAGNGGPRDERRRVVRLVPQGPGTRVGRLAELRVLRP